MARLNQNLEMLRVTFADVPFFVIIKLSKRNVPSVSQKGTSPVSPIEQAMGRSSGIIVKL